ncbi:MAG TPA: DUF4351 domain-containing protein [Fimbriiglobus sp.]
MTGPLALIPLAPIAANSRDEVKQVVTRMSDRMWAETDPATFQRLANAAMFLLTMRYDAMITKGAFTDHPALKEVFDLFRDDGRAEEARTMILRIGRKRLGAPKPEHEAAITQETDFAKLEALSGRLLDVNTWDEMFAPAK